LIPDKRPLLLMADDDKDDCMLANEALNASRAKGTIYFVNDGVELMKYLSLATRLPALILLDLNMPLKDGYQALKEIKSNPALQTIPVVVLTTSKDENDLNYCRKAGANSFITKPSCFSEWIKIMRSLSDAWLLTA
jgi:CheY-like chemotaxis protein